MFYVQSHHAHANKLYITLSHSYNTQIDGQINTNLECVERWI